MKRARKKQNRQQAVSLITASLEALRVDEWLGAEARLIALGASPDVAKRIALDAELSFAMARAAGEPLVPTTIKDRAAAMALLHLLIPIVERHERGEPLTPAQQAYLQKLQDVIAKVRP